MSISLYKYNTFPTNFIFVDKQINFLNNSIKTENIGVETRFNMIFSYKSSEDEEELNLINNSDSYTFISSLLDPNPMPSLNEIIPINSIDSENKNDSPYNLFTKNEKSIIEINEDENILKRKRFKEKRPRKENKDNIRKKIKRGFFNNAVISKLNEKLKNLGNNNFFQKFPQHIVSDVNKKRNKEISNMTLEEIFEKKELYLNENKYDLCYSENMKVLQSQEIKENKEFKKILNKTIRELYEEYINSIEFNIEINRLKKKKMRDDYITKYINLAKNLILYFTQ